MAQDDQLPTGEPVDAGKVTKLAADITPADIDYILRAAYGDATIDEALGKKPEKRDTLDGES